MKLADFERSAAETRGMFTDACEYWLAEIDEVEQRFDSKEKIAAFLTSIEQQSKGHVSVLIDHGPRKGWRRFLGAKRDVSPCFAAEWDSRYASLIFLDDAWSEYRAIDVSHPVAPCEEVRRAVAHGELIPHPIAECMEKARAFTLMQDFLIRGGRPEWLTYNFVT